MRCSILLAKNVCIMFDSLSRRIVALGSKIETSLAERTGKSSWILVCESFVRTLILALCFILLLGTFDLTVQD